MEETKKPFYRYCIVPKCTNTIRSAPDKVYFQVPRVQELRTQWCKIMRRDELSPTSCLYCCEDHFNVKEDTENYVQYNLMKKHGEKVTLRLKKGVLPHFFTCQNRSMPPPPAKMDAIKRQRLALIEEALSEFAVKNNHDCDEYQARSSTSKIEVYDDHEADPNASHIEVCHDDHEDEPSTSHNAGKLCGDKAVQVNIKMHYRSKALCDLAAQDSTREEFVGPNVNDTPPCFDRDSVCRCCLSSSRSLSTLDQSELGAGASSGARICWECAATLARLRKFRERVDAAEALLREAEETQITSEIKSLSTLTSYTKDTYDYLFTFDYPLNKILEPTPRQRKQTLQARAEFQKTMEINFLPHNIENLEINSQHNVKQEGEDPEVKIEQTDYYNTKANDATTDNDAKSSVLASLLCSNSYDAATEINDDTADTEEPLIHYDVKQEIDNPLIENEFTVRYMTEEEMRERRYADRQTSRYRRSSFKCEMCICYFLSPKFMMKHMKERHGKNAGRYMCRVCQQRFAEAGALSEHCRQHYVTYCCRECGFSDRRLLNMNQHLKEHAARQSGLTRESSAKRRRAERPKFICDDCGFEFLWKNQIKRHFIRGQCSSSPTTQNTENSVRNECGICYETINYSLKKHYRTCHLPTERPRCRDCNKELTSQAGYVFHRQNIHLPRKFKCKYCNKLFARKLCRREHINMNHVVVLKHKCAACNKAFASRTALRRHSSRVHERCYMSVCMFCGKSIRDSALEEHWRTHTGERPYQCAHCQRAFAQRSNILSHIKRLHKEVMMTHARGQ